MTTPPLLITCDTPNDANSITSTVNFFSLQKESSLWSSEVLLYSDFLEKLVFHISRKPCNLLAHLQRIHYCFHAQLNEHLFAAIVDLFIILNRRGLAISWRVLTGVSSHLTDEQIKILQGFLQNADTNVELLEGNQYAIFTRGLIGTDDMVRPVETQQDGAFDPLAIAHDHIEYFQLDEAKQVLETAVLDQPTRWDFQEELLSLYRSTRDASAFSAMFTRLKESGITLNDEWHTLNNYFKGQNHNG